MKKKFLAGVLALILICAMAGAGTMAYFTSQAYSEGNTFVTGELILGGIIDGEDVEEEFAHLSLDMIKPGVPVHIGTTQLKNVGNLPFKLYRITASDFGGQFGELDDVLILTARINGEHVYTGKFSELVESNGGYFDPIYNIEPGDVLPLDLEVLMDESAGNEYQNKTLVCDLTVYAAQENMPLNGEPRGASVNLGRAPGAGTILDPSFQVQGYDKSGEVWFDYDWLPNDGIYEYYELKIKHETGNPTTNIQEWRILLSREEKVVSTDGIRAQDVSVDWDEDIVKIKESAFPTDWAGFEVQLSGTRTATEEPQVIPYQYWVLHR